jgi:microcin C transport system substrate-binding protein
MLRKILMGLGLLSLCANLASGEKLPKNLTWQSNATPPQIASSKAKQGGSINLYLNSFPLTLRAVGPDSNGGFRGFLDSITYGLINLHPNTEEIIPEIAQSWAFGGDKKTMYFKLNPKATWSDGVKVTADDFLYAFEFYKNKHIVAPWYNQYYESQFDRVIKFDDHTIAVVMKEAKPELHLYASISPLPRHFYGKLDKNFVKKFNWKIAPTTGPYRIDSFKRGKSVTFKKVEKWWGEDLHFYKNRFNVDKVKFKVIREQTVAFENLKKGKIDFMFVIWPDYWHEKTKGGPFEDGYIEKLMFYTDSPEGDYGMEMNLKHDLLKDINIRLGIQHAINVEKVIDKVLRGDYLRLQGLSQGYGKYTNPKISARKYDLKLANQYFDKAGFKKRAGDGIRVKGKRRLSATVTYSSENMAPRLVVMREELKRAGFDLKLQKLDSSAGFKFFLEKKHEIAYMAWGAQIRPDYRGRFHSENADRAQTNNFTNLKDAEIDTWAEAYRTSVDLNKRVKLAHKIQQKIHDLAVIIPLFRVPYFRVAYWRYIELPDIPGTKRSTGIDLFGASTGGLFWINKDKKNQTKKMRKKRKKLDSVTRVMTQFKPRG